MNARHGAQVSTGVIQEPGCIRLELDNRPEHVSVVRSALAGLAEAAGFEPELGMNLETAISEACNNIVLHAYDGGRGPMFVDINWDQHLVDVIVADRGSGIQRVSSAAEHMGLGLALISALSSQAEFRSPQQGGTEVRMRFRREKQASEAGIPRDGVWHAASPGLDGDVVLWCQPVPVLRHVLGRLARAVAARSRFTVRGAESLFAINDEIASYAEWAADGHVIVAITAQTRELRLDSGPFLYDLDELQKHLRTEEAGEDESSASREDHLSLPDLVDEISFKRDDGTGRLHILIRDSGRESEV